MVVERTYPPQSGVARTWREAAGENRVQKKVKLSAEEEHRGTYLVQ